MAVQRNIDFIVEKKNTVDSRATIRAALRADADFTGIVETDTGFAFQHTPRSPLLMATSMSLSFFETGTAVRIKATTTSQQVIIGDVFGMYPRMLRQLKSGIESAFAAGVRDDEPSAAVLTPRRSIGYGSVVIGIIAASFLTSIVGGLPAVVGGAILGFLVVAVLVTRLKARRARDRTRSTAT